MFANCLKRLLTYGIICYVRRISISCNQFNRLADCISTRNTRELFFFANVYSKLADKIYRLFKYSITTIRK